MSSNRVREALRTWRENSSSVSERLGPGATLAICTGSVLIISSSFGACSATLKNAGAGRDEITAGGATGNAAETVRPLAWRRDGRALAGRFAPVPWRHARGGAASPLSLASRRPTAASLAFRGDGYSPGTAPSHSWEIGLIESVTATVRRIPEVSTIHRGPPGRLAETKRGRVLASRPAIRHSIRTRAAQLLQTPSLNLTEKPRHAATP